MTYSDFKISIRLLSPVGTPWQADTLIGQLAYLVASHEGDDACKKFLQPFLDGAPSFIFSDAFPSGLLPKPLTFSIPGQAKSPSEYALLKKRKKAGFLKVDDFELVRKGELPKGEPVSAPWVRTETLHASIDRRTWTTAGEGNLFTTWADALKEPYKEINLYLRARDGAEAQALKLLKELSLLGFGRDKSTGHGQFEILKMEPIDIFSSFNGANGFISLSTFVPAADDPIDGQWNVNVKFGKLGEALGSSNPFKRPLIQLTPGSTFKTTGAIKPFYGRVVRDISPIMPEAVQICYAFSVPCIYP